MDPISISLAAVASGGAIYGAISSFLSNKKAEEQALYYGGLQASEILRRNAYNESILRENEVDFENKVAVSAGRGGVYTGIGEILSSRLKLERNLIMYRQEAEFKAKMAREGAQGQADLFSDRATASLLTGVSQVSEYAADAWSKSDAFSAPDNPLDLSTKEILEQGTPYWGRDPRSIANIA